MNLPVEPACYVWAEPMADGIPPAEFTECVEWLDSFFAWNRHCRVPMTAELRESVASLFPYAAAAAAGRIGRAQELVAIITRLIDRVGVRPFLEYSGAEERVARLSLIRDVSPYDKCEDLWLSWCDLLGQCLCVADQDDVLLYAVAAVLNTCAPAAASPGVGRIRWVRAIHGLPPDGTVDPRQMSQMKARWRALSCPVVWEDSGHQPPIPIKRLVSRLVADCEGVVLRFGSTYFNPSMASRCNVAASGTLGDAVSELLCSVSDGVATLRGALRTTAETEREQAAALSFVRRRLAELCDESGLPH